ncbi:hypothetical protein AVEN_80079-1 [Araneus ventricosus]|uniref:Uncharacterized protein n=1 Tax=Araneus ventricosus TaxID=182803 RepID=A0A4Y2QN19_ARAVE|nr:hypothetical protein AVEN_80079-1 [Araneus ventricosus]
MESLFPAMRVLWLGREFYKGKYEMTDSSHVWTPDLGDKLGDLATNLANWRRNMGSQRCWNLLDISISRGDMLECTRRFHVTSWLPRETI